MNHHRRSAQVWHVFSRDFTVLPAHPHVHSQSEWVIPAFAFPAITGTLVHVWTLFSTCRQFCPRMDTLVHVWTLLSTCGQLRPRYNAVYSVIICDNVLIRTFKSKIWFPHLTHSSSFLATSVFLKMPNHSFAFLADQDSLIVFRAFQKVSLIVSSLLGVIQLSRPYVKSASGCVVECRICNWEVAGSNLGLGYFAPRSTQLSTPTGSVNEYQL